MKTSHAIAFAARLTWRRPLASLGVIALLSLGSALALSTFSLVTYIVSDALPYPQSDALLLFHDVFLRTKPDLLGVSEPEFFDYRREATVFSGISAIASGKRTVFTMDGPVRVASAEVSTNLLQVLRSRPYLGRDFTSADETLGAENVAVVSDHMFRSILSCQSVSTCHFQSGGELYSVVGVLAPQFRMPDDLSSSVSTDLLLPLRLDPANLSYRDNPRLTVLGRLRHHAEIAAAQAEMNRIAASLRIRYPKVYTPELGFIVRVQALREAVLGNTADALSMAAIAASLLFLVAVTNAANILLIANERRIPTLLTALALGAPIRTIRIQLLAESLLLSVASFLPGMFLGWLIFIFVVRVSAGRFLPLLRDAHFSAIDSLFSIALLFCASVIMFLIPQGTLARAKGLLPSINRETRTSTAPHSRVRFQNFFLIIQMMLSTALIALFLLVGLSQHRMQQVDLGINTDAVTVNELILPAASYKENGEVLTFFDTLLARISTEQITRDTCLAASPPLIEHNETWPFDLEDSTGKAGAAPTSFGVEIMSHNCLHVLRAQLLEGADFPAQKRPGSIPMALVSASLAHQLWPSHSAVGQRFRPKLMPNAPWVTIIGVVADVRHEGPNSPLTPLAYLNYEDIPALTSATVRIMKTLTRSSLSPKNVHVIVQQAARTLDPNIPVELLGDLDEVRSRLTAPWKFTGQLLSVTSLLGPLIALSGLYSLLSTLMVLRRREFGIRIALGATKSSILYALSKRTLIQVILGGILGTWLCFVLFLRLRSFLPQTALAEALAFSIMGILTLAVMAVIASATLVPIITANLPETLKET